MTDKNFDDSELEDIMREIEELENADDNFDEISAEESEESEDSIDTAASANDAEMEDIIEQELEELNQIDEVAEAKEEDPDSLGDMIDDVLNSEEEEKQDLQAQIDSDVSSVEPENVVSLNKGDAPMENKSTSPCEMNLKVSGDLNINLDFSLSGQKVQLIVSEENGLEIVMDGGAKFSLPVNLADKKAA